VLVGASLNPLKLLLCVGVLVCARGCHGQAKNRSGKRARLAHKVRKPSELMFRGNDQERETAPSRLVAALPVDAISNASSAESRPCANARASRAV
jgi:hypothetical protein